MTTEAQKILSCIYRVNQSYGVNVVTQVLKGSRNKRVLGRGLDKTSTYGIMREYSNTVIKEMIMTLISKGYIQMTADKYPVIRLTAKSKEILNGKVKFYHKKDLLQRPEPSKADDGLSLAQIDENFDKDLFESLRQLRHTIAQSKGLPPYIIFHDVSLKEMAT